MVKKLGICLIAAAALWGLSSAARAEYLLDLRPKTASLPSGITTTTDAHTLNVGASVAAGSKITFDVYATVTGTGTNWTYQKLATVQGGIASLYSNGGTLKGDLGYYDPEFPNLDPDDPEVIVSYGKTFAMTLPSKWAGLGSSGGGLLGGAYGGAQSGLPTSYTVPGTWATASATWANDGHVDIWGATTALNDPGWFSLSATAAQPMATTGKGIMIGTVTYTISELLSASNTKSTVIQAWPISDVPGHASFPIPGAFSGKFDNNSTSVSIGNPPVSGPSTSSQYTHDGQVHGLSEFFSIPLVLQGTVQSTTKVARTITADPTSVTLGNVLSGATVSQQVTLSTTGSNADYYDAQAAASSNVVNGLSLVGGSTMFTNNGQSANWTLGGAINLGAEKFGPAAGVLNLAVTASEGSDPSDVAVSYTANVIGTAAVGQLWSTNPIAGSYAGLQTQLGNGNKAIGASVATILSGTGAGAAVNEQWRSRNAAEALNRALVSDVVDLTGVNGAYVLQMSYDDSLFANNTENLTKDSNGLFLGYKDGGKWVNAGTGANLGAWGSGYTTVGQWGVDTVNNVAWAVVNHTSEYAVVPEPATIALLLSAGMAFGLVLIRRKRAK